MSIEIELFNRLKAQVPLVSNRVYAGIAPQGVTKPYLVYTKVSPGRQYTHGGYADLQRPRMQVSCYGTTYGSAKAVAGEVITAMEGWPGSNDVQAAFIEGEQDMFEQDTGLYHCPVDVILWNNA